MNSFALRQKNRSEKIYNFVAMNIRSDLITKRYLPVQGEKVNDRELLIILIKYSKHLNKKIFFESLKAITFRISFNAKILNS